MTNAKYLGVTLSGNLTWNNYVDSIAITRGNETLGLKRGCVEFKYYADAVHSGLTPPG